MIKALSRTALPHKILPEELTSYDVLKALAVLLMVVDHIGSYFYPEELWLRVIGRACVPMWFFLVGFARSRYIGPPLFVGIALLTLADILTGRSVLSITILLTIIVVRLVIDRVGAISLRKDTGYWAMIALMVALCLPTMMLMEYGAQGVILALLGYYVRARMDGDVRVTSSFLIRHTLVATAFYALMQTGVFGFAQAQFLVMATLVAAVMVCLHNFRPVTFAGTAQGGRKWLALPVRLIGRHTLFIYVAHLLVFKFAVLYFWPERFEALIHLPPAGF